jgi:predicted ATP-grasp superfamily ATP-dependent carboligase
MFVEHSPAELLQTYDCAEDPDYPNLMLQEYIPGGDDTIWMFNGYFDAASECLGGFTGKKIRQCPIHTGSTSLGICLANAEVEQTTRRFMKSIGYRGILDIGYRYDARDGLYKVLDVNPRIGATFRLFAGVNGIDVARALYSDLTGQWVIPSPAREGRKWIVEDLDAVSTHRYCREGSLTIKQWFASLRGIEEAALSAAGEFLHAGRGRKVQSTYESRFADRSDVCGHFAVEPAPCLSCPPPGWGHCRPSCLASNFSLLGRNLPVLGRIASLAGPDRRPPLRW